MKKIMKKALSLVIVMAMMLVPMTSWAAPGQWASPTGTGTDSDPYVITADETGYAIPVNANSRVFVKTTAGATIKGLGSYNGGFALLATPFASPIQSDGNTEISMELDAGAEMFILVNENADEANTILVSASAGSSSEGPAGTMNDPAIIEMQEMYGSVFGEASVDLEAGNAGYYYKITAPADGAIFVDVAAYDESTSNYELGYMFYVNNNTKGSYGDYIYRTSENATACVEVSKNDELLLFVSTFNSENPYLNPQGTIGVQVGFSSVGSYNYPEEVVVGTYTANVPAQNVYYYSYTAPSKGTVKVAVADDATNWAFTVNNTTTGAYGDRHTSTAEPVVTYEELDVASGDVLSIVMGTPDYAANSFDWSLSFEADTTSGGGSEGGNNPAGTIDNPDTLTLGANVDEIAAGGFMYYYTWTAPGKGTFTVYGDELQSPDGYGYVVMVNDENVGSGSSANTTEDHQDKTAILVEKDQVVEVRVYRPDFSSGKFAIRAEFANYKISDTVLGVKENAVTLDQDHEYTTFVFEVAEDGNYTISTTGTVIGNWGSIDWNLNNPNATTNTMTMDLEKDQTFYFGVPSDKAECTITIVRNGDIEDDGPTYAPYANKVTPEAYTFESTEDNLIYINVKDKVEDTIVLGKDGFYHFGTENGPVVLVDLANETLSFAAMVGSGIGEDVGTTPARDPYNMVDYTAAIQAYVANSDKETNVYPLTEDLITFFKVYGESQGWYGTKLGFNLFGDDAVDPEKYWMFACCYVYEVVEGDNATWTQGSTDGLTIKANGEFDEFIRLEVDGKEVDKANYTVKEGSTIVTLSKDYLATLSVGEHTVTFVYENNGFEYTADATITIATPVKAGDATNIALWIAVLGLGVVAIAGSVVMRKKEF